MSDPSAKLAPKQKKFLLLLLEGHSPEDACKLIWPKVYGPYSHIAAVMDSEKFKLAYQYLTKHRFSREAFLQKCEDVANDAEAKTSDKVNALKLAAQLSGHIAHSSERYPRAVKKDKAGGNSDIISKMAELAMKAGADGHHKKPA
ncbi:MAG: hypothetical protein PVS2B2_26060 [Candidatus Acidiferrum sp.]